MDHAITARQKDVLRIFGIGEEDMKEKLGREAEALWISSAANGKDNKRMARQISLQGIDTKIAKAKERVLRIKASYENALHELDELNTLRREAEEKEIIRAVRRSGKSFQEVMRLIRL